ncbi:MAG: glycosyltransferase [Proteobacteria bacterium]|nr:glycosyltransferase [Pseudomonadota bacterium]
MSGPRTNEPRIGESRAHQPRYGIDRLVMRGRRVFGWGWIADPASPIESLALSLEGDGWRGTLPVTCGLARPDVEEAWPRLPGAGSSGFVVTGYADASPARSAVLEVRYTDGGVSAIDVTAAVERASSGGARKLRALGYLVRAVGRRLARGDLRGIAERAGAQNYGAASLDDAPVRGALVAQLRGERAIAIVFDHNMGGGANVYRREVIASRVAAGKDVLLCTYNFPTLDYRVELFERSGVEGGIYRAGSYLALEPIVDAVTVDEIFVNSPVSFDEPLAFAEWLALLREAKRVARLTIAINDYFAVCPSFVLLNAEGRYCGIPALSECARCLAAHRASWMALSPPSAIGPWRAIWGRCLGVADEVRCFSQSSRELVLRAWPELAAGKLTVVPHRVDYVPQRAPSIDHQAPLTVAVVGQISVQKGAEIVRELVLRADRERLPVKVVVIGALDLRVESKRLTVTGRYRREELAGLIEAHGVNMALFPSICPETFSYVVEELVRLALPIVAFDLGAPAERLRGYAGARLCSEVSAGAALDTIVEFHRELADGRPAAAAASEADRLAGTVPS